MIKTKQREVALYETKDGKTPFLKWLRKLRDRLAKAKILARIDRASEGNFGEYKQLGEIYELKERSGPGYRIYFAIEKSQIILLLMGGDKSSQKEDIEKAKSYYQDHKARKRK